MFHNLLDIVMQPRRRAGLIPAWVIVHQLLLLESRLKSGLGLQLSLAEGICR